MPRIQSEIDSSNERFRANHERMSALAADLRKQVEAVSLGGGEEARRKHTSRGKLLPRERVQSLLDTGSPFLELSPLAAHGMYGGDAPPPGLITRGGRLPPPAAPVLPDAATGKRGTDFPLTLKKNPRA